MRRNQPYVEPLENRTLLSLTVQLDFSFDTGNFFDTAAKRSVLQAAVNAAVAPYGDHLAAINPSPLLDNTWTATIANPATGSNSNITNAIVPEDTLVVFVGARDISALGVG